MALVLLRILYMIYYVSHENIHDCLLGGNQKPQRLNTVRKSNRRSFQLVEDPPGQAKFKHKIYVFEQKSKNAEKMLIIWHLDPISNETFYLSGMLGTFPDTFQEEGM